MPKKQHSKFVLSSDPYPAIDMTKPEIVYEDTLRLESLNEQDWESFMGSMLQADDLDLTFPAQHHNSDASQISFEYPEYFRCTLPSNPEDDYGLKPDYLSETLAIEELLDDDHQETECKDETDSTQEPAYSELLEDDWDIGGIDLVNIGTLRKEHSAEFQSDAGLDFGDETQGQVDDDEGDVWAKEE